MSTSAVHLPEVQIAAVPDEGAGLAPAPRPWPPARRVAFRFAFVYLLLYNLPFPLDLLPLGDAGETWYPKLWEPIVAWVGAHVLRLAEPIAWVPTGSGDTRFQWVLALCFVAISALAAVVWTAVDRRRTRYPVAGDFLRAWVRYNVGYAMVLYGSAKVFETQFVQPGVGQLVQPVGNLTGMGLLWTFMGASYAYNLFAGIGELAGGVLLFWRRTTTLGACILVAVLANVVMMNFAYDVPVKQFSTHLLLMTLFLLAPQARRMADFFVLNRPVPPADLGRFAGGRWPRARRVLKAAGMVMMAVMVLHLVGVGLKIRRELTHPPLYGIYDVQSFARNGRTPPPPLVERTQWRRVVFPMPGALSVTDMADSTYYYAMEIDTVAGRMELWRGREPGVRYSLSYTRPAAGVVQIGGLLQGDTLSVRLRRVDETKLAKWRRPFRWVTDPAMLGR